MKMGLECVAWLLLADTAEQLTKLKEYAVKRGGAKPQLAESEAKKSHKVSVRGVPSATDRAKLSRVRSSEALATIRLKPAAATRD
jgi:hypothetical protein